MDHPSAPHINHSSPAERQPGAFRNMRIEAPSDVPEAGEHFVDVALLDMNHGWPNLGHDSLVHAVREVASDLLPTLQKTGLCIRVLSYEVRRRAMVPEAPGGRFSVYLGTGGPGHIDPHHNDGVSEGSQGIREDPSWEEPLFGLLDAVRAHPDAALLAVCHTFGVLCRWSGVARPVLRGPEKGGKSAGVLENELTPEALAHPWFRRFAKELPDGRRLPVVDNRLYDLIPEAGKLAGVVPVGYETRGVGGPRGEALTMMELARDRGGEMPRILGVNHHAEIVDRRRQLLILGEKRSRGEVSARWFEERALTLTRAHPDDETDRLLRMTSDYTLLGPLRFYLHRQLRERASALGVPVDLHEDRMLGDALSSSAATGAASLPRAPLPSW